MRVFFAINVCLWFVLFVAWIPYTAMMGLADPVSTRVGFILATTGVLLVFQGLLRYLRTRRRRVT